MRAESHALSALLVLISAGCGANCAFMTLPTPLAATVRPMLTGFLADPSVLSPSSSGIGFGSQARRGNQEE